jgi:hypothetical protein
MITIKKRKSNIHAVAVTAAVFVAFVVFLVVMLNNASALTGEEALQAVTDSVIRAAVSCFAYEGFYPDSLDYLTENYNLRIDFDRYFVYYSRIAENLMPNIIVTERGVN